MGIRLLLVWILRLRPVGNPSKTQWLTRLHSLRMLCSSRKLRLPTIQMAEQEVTIVLRLTKRKFGKLMQDGSVKIFKWEVSHGFTWTRRDEDKVQFETTLNNFIRELNKVKGREMQ
ncbi:uncharacterized protein LOC131054678 [Cryptomeria japonica]|uniref:uncharacterized protein LOC131054678 n=1 Tax=Cryptomeria japonica TaxID=3369 RepID=UPI0025AC7B92|nr:uncharacterized protein LOC131054678 [Cryptomeria japonica]